MFAMTSESAEHSSINPFNTYLVKVNPLLEAMVAALLLERPDDVKPFMKAWLEREHAGMTDAPIGGSGAVNPLATADGKDALRDEILDTIRKVKILEGKHEEIMKLKVDQKDELMTAEIEAGAKP